MSVVSGSGSTLCSIISLWFGYFWAHKPHITYTIESVWFQYLWLAVY